MYSRTFALTVIVLVVVSGLPAPRRFGGPISAFADDVPQALQLLELSIKCPIAPFDPHVEEAPHGETPTNNLELDENEYQGDQRVFTIVTRSSFVSSYSERRPAKWANAFYLSAPFARLGSVSIEGPKVTLRCRPNQGNCAVEKLLSTTLSEEVEEISFRVCDAEAASNVKAAIDMLISANR